MGAFKGALFKYLKININNINALSLLFVPIIGTILHAIFTKSENTPCAIFVSFPARNKSIYLACSASDLVKAPHSVALKRLNHSLFSVFIDCYYSACLAI